MIDMNKMAKQSFEIARRRQMNGMKGSLNTIPMLKYCAGEVVEAAESYNNFKLAANVLSEKINQRQFASELGDIMCCVMIIAHAENINLEQIIQDSIHKNRKRAEGTGDKI